MTILSSEGKTKSFFFDHTVSAYVLQVKVEMEMEIQQYEKAKAVREEQLDRLTQICQEQAVRPPLPSSPPSLPTPSKRNTSQHILTSLLRS